MDWKSTWARARRGWREELRLYLVAISSLSVAFVCVGGALLAVTNLDAMAARWGESGRLSVYLADGAATEDVARIRTVLDALPEVAEVEQLSADQARAIFLEQSGGSDLDALPAEVFPASLEVELAAGTSRARVDEIGESVAALGAVTDVETYSGFFERLDGLLSAGRGLAGALAFLVGLCVLAVIGNTIRLAVARRRDEIEVMKLCGATDSFVRRPFVIEGTLQGVLSAGVSLIVLFAGFLILRGHLDASVAALAGMRASFLQMPIVVGMLLGGALIGAAGSALSLRRYLTV